MGGRHHIWELDVEQKVSRIRELTPLASALQESWE